MKPAINLKSWRYYLLWWLCTILTFSQPAFSQDTEYQLDELDPEKLINPEKFKQKPFFDAATWADGPITVGIGGIASIKIPSGYRYLTHENYRALREAIDDPLSEDDNSTYVEAPDGRWSAIITLIPSGHVDTKSSLPDPEELLQQFHSKAFGFFSTTRDPNYGISHLLSWSIEPELNLDNQRLTWAINHSDTRSTALTEPERTLFVARLGRAYSLVIAVDFSGIFNVESVQRYAPEVIALADGIEFKEGERYSDAKTTEDITPLEYLIIGPPTPKQITAMNAFAREDMQKQEKIANAMKHEIILLVSVAIIFLGALISKRK